MLGVEDPVDARMRDVEEVQPVEEDEDEELLEEDEELLEEDEDLLVEEEDGEEHLEEEGLLVGEEQPQQQPQ